MSTDACATLSGVSKPTDKPTDKPTAASITRDLVDEQSSLDDVVAGLADEQWSLPTPSPRWAVRQQIAHLAFFDEQAALAICDPDGFAAHRTEFMRRASGSAEAADDAQFGDSAAMSPGELLAHWRRARQRLAAAAAGLADDDRVDWYGPSMGARSFLTARLMEAWAHGQDVCDALGATREPSDRLRHIAQLGFITRGWTYANRGLPVPTTEVRVELTAPSGEQWAFGAEGSADKVSGSAEDFCLVTAQRRNVADSGLVVHGAAAAEWLSMAQLFAGPPSDPPAAAG